MSKLKALLLATAVAAAVALPGAAQAQSWGGLPRLRLGRRPVGRLRRLRLRRLRARDSGLSGMARSFFGDGGGRDSGGLSGMARSFFGGGGW